MYKGELKRKLTLRLKEIRKKPQTCAALLLVVLGIIFGTAAATQAFGTDSIEFLSSDSIEAAAEGSHEDLIYVHVAGEVAEPGVYQLPLGSRVIEAVEMAGGFTENAKQDSLNLAAVLSDGEKVLVMSGGSSSSSATGETSYSDNGLININTAGSAELQTLKGVGESTAKKIIAYRESNGGFRTIEDIKNVSGIGDKRFEAIKSFICV